MSSLTARERFALIIGEPPKIQQHVDGSLNPLYNAFFNASMFLANNQDYDKKTRQAYYDALIHEVSKSRGPNAIQCLRAFNKEYSSAIANPINFDERDLLPSSNIDHHQQNKPVQP